MPEQQGVCRPSAPPQRVLVPRGQLDDGQQRRQGGRRGSLSFQQGLAGTQHCVGIASQRDRVYTCRGATR